MTAEDCGMTTEDRGMTAEDRGMTAEATEEIKTNLKQKDAQTHRSEFISGSGVYHLSLEALLPDEKLEILGGAMGMLPFTELAGASWTQNSTSRAPFNHLYAQAGNYVPKYPPYQVQTFDLASSDLGRASTFFAATASPTGSSMMTNPFFTQNNQVFSNNAVDQLQKAHQVPFELHTSKTLCSALLSATSQACDSIPIMTRSTSINHLFSLPLPSILNIINSSDSVQITNPHTSTFSHETPSDLIAMNQTPRKFQTIRGVFSVEMKREYCLIVLEFSLKNDSKLFRGLQLWISCKVLPAFC